MMRKEEERKNININAIFCHVWENGNLSGKHQVKPSAASQVSFSLYVDKPTTPACLKPGQKPRFLYTPGGPILSCIRSAQNRTRY